MCLYEHLWKNELLHRAQWIRVWYSNQLKSATKWQTILSYSGFAECGGTVGLLNAEAHGALNLLMLCWINDNAEQSSSGIKNIHRQLRDMGFHGRACRCTVYAVQYIGPKHQQIICKNGCFTLRALVYSTAVCMTLWYKRTRADNKKPSHMCRFTLYVWVVHKIKKTSKQGVGCSVSPSKVKIQGEPKELRFWKWRPIVASLRKSYKWKRKWQTRYERRNGHSHTYVHLSALKLWISF